MNKLKYHVLIIIIFAISFNLNAGYSEPLPDYFQVAVKLYSNSYYQEARMLLLTMLYTHSLTYPFNLYSKFLVAMTYAKESNISRSILELKELQKIIETNIEKDSEIDSVSNTLLCETNYQIAKLYFFEKKIDLFLEAKEYFDSECLLSNKIMMDELTLLEIASFTYEMKWKDALNIIKKYDINNDKLKNYLLSKLSDITRHRDKSPLLGGLLSIIPGLGHMYAGRFSDGLRSFLFNSTFSGLTLYTGMHKEYIFTGIFGLTELVLYAANIYGGINAVIQENAIYYTKNRDKILKRIPISNIQILSIRKEIGL